MNQSEILFSALDDKYYKCTYDYIIVSGAFLDTYQQSDVLNYYSRKNDCKMFLFGGTEENERNLPVFIPDYMEIDSVTELSDYFKSNPDDNPIDCIRADKDKFSTLTHRDYLGALMGLGIKREMIGDIEVDEKGAYIFALKKISTYICNNLTSAGRATINAKIIPFNEFKPAEKKIEEKISTVSSLRLDNIVSLCYNLSRGKSVDMISSGLVFLNGVECTKADKKISEGDKIVLRGKGKSIVKEIVGKTKKDRFLVAMEIYK